MTFSGSSRRTFLGLTVGVGAIGVLGVHGLGPLGSRPAEASGGAGTDWLYNGRWGLFNQNQMSEWRSPQIFDPVLWNQAVDAFDVDAVADELANLGAGYLIHCLGQNGGYYSAPNATYDGYVGYAQSHCSNRDLAAELGAALHARGLKLLVYIPNNAPAQDAQAVAALEWSDGPNRNANFQVKWQNILTEWGQRWGNLVDGWWFDGCYWPGAMYDFTTPPNWDSFAAAARAGNSSRLLAFNPGVQNPIQAECPQEDYAAGETINPNAVFCDGRWLTAPANSTAPANPNIQFQMLSYLGATWGSGDPRLSTAGVVAASNSVVNAGGVVTWDAPLSLPSGVIEPRFADQLAAMSAALGPARSVTTIRNDTDPAIQYQGSWAYNGGRNVPDYGRDVHYTSQNGDWAQVAFTGTGIQYLTENDSDMGAVDIYLDGAFQRTVDCFDGGGKVYQQVPYQVQGLAAGSHTLRIVKTGGQVMLLDAVKITA